MNVSRLPICRKLLSHYSIYFCIPSQAPYKKITSNASENNLPRATATVIIITNKQQQKPNWNRYKKKDSNVVGNSKYIKQGISPPQEKKRTREARSIEGLWFMHISSFVGWAFFLTTSVCQKEESNRKN